MAAGSDEEERNASVGSEDVSSLGQGTSGDQQIDHTTNITPEIICNLWQWTTRKDECRR